MMQKTTCLRKLLGFKMVRSGVSHASSQSPWLPNSEALAPEVNTAPGGLPAALPVIKEQERGLPWTPKIPLWAPEDLLSAVNFTIRATLSPSWGRKHMHSPLIYFFCYNEQNSIKPPSIRDSLFLIFMSLVFLSAGRFISRL